MTLPLNRRGRIAALAIAAAAAATAAVMGTAPAQAAPARGDILPAGTAAVPDSYVVVLKDSAAVRARGVRATVGDLSARYGGSVGFIYQFALKGFEVSSMSRTAAERLAANPAVAYVQQNGIHTISGTQSPVPSWGLDRIDQRNLPLDNSYTFPTTASGVRAYIIDTGIRFTHTDFGGRAISGFDAVDGGTADDCHGHGTHVSGTTGGASYGVAKAVTLVAVRVLNCQGSGTSSQVVAGIDWATGDHDPGELAVANMSLGGGVDTAIDNAVNNSISDGITYAIAAGNSNADACNSSPARVPAAITVGATDINDNRASFSNFGTCLDIFAPGVNITSAWSTSDTATNTISGTSMATPHVTGAAALVLAQNPSFTPQQVRDFLVTNATTGVVNNPGSGSPNRLLFVVNNGAPPPADDFSISVSPTSGSTTAGGSVSATVSTATTSGNAQTVSLSASGLPSGASASFSPSSVTSGGSSTMTISTSSTTPAGTFSITITGTGTSATHSTTYSLTVTSSGGCSGAGQKLVNPGFESGSTGWTATSGVIGQWGPFGQPPHSGTWDAWLDGYGFSHTDYVYQAVSLPAGCSSYTLSFWLHVDTSETTSSIAYDTLRVQILNTSGTVLATLATYSNLDAASGYSQKSLNVAAWAGQTVRVRWIGVEDFILQTSFVVDDTALNVS